MLPLHIACLKAQRRELIHLQITDCVKRSLASATGHMLNCSTAITAKLAQGATLAPCRDRDWASELDDAFSRTYFERYEQPGGFGCSLPCQKVSYGYDKLVNLCFISTK